MDLLNQLQKKLPTGTFSYDSETIDLPADFIVPFVTEIIGIITLAIAAIIETFPLLQGAQ